MSNMTQPAAPQVLVDHPVPFNDPHNGNGFTFVTTVTTGPYVPPPPPARRVLLGGNVPLATKVSGMGVVRRYAGQAGKGYNPQGMINAVKADAANGALTLLSIGPGDNKAAPYDSTAMEAFRPAIEASNTIAIPWHEPENDNQPPATYQRFYMSFVTQFPKATIVPVLMGITYINDKQDQWIKGLPSSFIGADPYIHHGQTAASQYDPARKYAESVGKQLIIAETGVLADTDQAAGLADIRVYCAMYPSIYALAYWSEIGKPPYDWTLGIAGLNAFQNLLKSAPFAPIH